MSKPKTSQYSPVYLSDSRPKFEPYEIDCGKIPAYRYKVTWRPS